MIDLDEHNHQSAESGTSVHDRLVVRQKMTLRLVAAFVVGVVLGGFGVSQLRDSRDQRERNAVVAFVAFPQSADSGSAAPRDPSDCPGIWRWPTPAPGRSPFVGFMQRGRASSYTASDRPGCYPLAAPVSSRSSCGSSARSHASSESRCR